MSEDVVQDVPDQLFQFGNNDSGQTISDIVASIAEENLKENGIVFIQESGLYYDSNQNCYYNPDSKLYYYVDHEAYYFYSEETGSLELYHSFKGESASSQNSEALVSDTSNEEQTTTEQSDSDNTGLTTFSNKEQKISQVESDDVLANEESTNILRSSEVATQNSEKASLNINNIGEIVRERDSEKIVENEVQTAPPVISEKAFLENCNEGRAVETENSERLLPENSSEQKSQCSGELLLDNSDKLPECPYEELTTRSLSSGEILSDDSIDEAVVTSKYSAEKRGFSSQNSGNVRLEDSIEERVVAWRSGSVMCSSDYNELPQSEEAVDEQIEAPCLRLAVKNSEEEGCVGKAFIVTCYGATLGRCGCEDLEIPLPDELVSKVHSKFTCDTSSGCSYHVQDAGSKNGTFLDGKRIPSGVPSAVHHGSVVKVGTTELLCHIHVMYEACPECSEVDQPTEGKRSHTESYRGGLSRLKKKYGIDNFSNAQMPRGYVDRARGRRMTKGSSCESEKTEAASVDEPIQESNRGYSLLKKMGWKEGQSIGRSNKK